MAANAAVEVSGRPGAQASSSQAKRIRPRLGLPKAYPLPAVLSFLSLLALLVALRARLPQEALRDLHWLLVIAVVPILPWLLPLAATHLKSFRAGPVELDFQHIDPGEALPGTREFEDAAEALAGASLDELPTRAGDIVERVREIEGDRTEVVVAKLKNDHWPLASLYLFAFLLESRTIVRRLVLEDGRYNDERAFLGMCSPRALRRSLEREHPLLKKVRRRIPIIELHSGMEEFFRALADDAGGRGLQTEYSMPVRAGRIVQIVGPALERTWINRSELQTLPGLRRVLAFDDRRYLAVAEPGRSYCVIDQYRVALNIARRATAH